MDFISPKLRIRIRPFKQVTIVPMPEATIYKNDGFVFGEHKVWFSGQVPHMKTIAEAQRK
jgi:hypothetical protein